MNMHSKPNDDDPEWTPERAYKRIRSMIIRMQAKENPTDTVMLCTDYGVRMSLCANGTLPVDRYESALEMLHENEEIAYGDRYLSYPNDANMAREAIEYVAAEDDPDREFIGRMNTLLGSGVLDGD